MGGIGGVEDDRMNVGVQMGAAVQQDPMIATVLREKRGAHPHRHEIWIEERRSDAEVVASLRVPGQFSQFPREEALGMTVDGAARDIPGQATVY